MQNCMLVSPRWLASSSPKIQPDVKRKNFDGFDYFDNNNSFVLVIFYMNWEKGKIRLFITK